MWNAKDILTSFKNIANITFIMRKEEKSCKNSFSSLSRHQLPIIDTRQYLGLKTPHSGAKKLWEIRKTQEEQ